MPNKEKETKVKKVFNETLLTTQQKKDFQFVKDRILQLQEVRQMQYGINIEKIWDEADRDYIPHRLKTRGKKVIVEDEDKGWRGVMVELGKSNWQSDISKPNPFIKIQTALSILVDQNPTGVFTPTTKKYESTSTLIKQLYQRSWEYAKSKQQLKLFIFNLAKYGWAIGRTYPLKITRKVKELVEYNEDNPEQSVYKEKEIIEYNDIMRDNLDPRNCWIDDMTRPNNEFSIRDWAWRKVYAMNSAQEEFGKYPNWKYVKSGGITSEKITGSKGQSEKQFKEKDLIEIYFYENRIKDLFYVIANGIPVIMESLPISDANGLKRLSCWQTYWTIRHAECPYGIGIYEAMKYDTSMLDRIRNMTIDQLTLSIYKSFFYQGTQSLTETGDIKIAPGVGKQVLDPKNINWLQVPGPGIEAWKGLEYFEKAVDEASGITDPLTGEITGKTAFELAQAKESALKRLKSPLDNVLDALGIEGYITVSLIQLLYSIPETYKISDPALIEDYLREIGSDPDLYERDEEENFVAKVYPEFPLNLEADETGKLIETQDTRFFRIKPKFLKWEGIISIKPQSILTPSKQIDKALDLEMYNILIPLLVQPPEIYSKVGKSIVKLYDKDPRDVLPESWLQTQQPQQPQQQQPMMGQETQPLMIPSNQMPQTQAPEAQTLIPSTQQPAQTPGIVGRIMNRINPFK